MPRNSPRHLEGPARRALRFAQKHRGVLKAIGFAAIYGFWILFVRLVVLSFITYVHLSPAATQNHQGPLARFEDINEAFGANELTLIGFAAILFVLLLRSLHPITSTTTQEIVTGYRLRKYFFPGFLQGVAVAFGIIFAFILSGIYRYLGYFIRFEEAPLALLNVALRIVAIGLLVYSEEFLFRHKIIKYYLGESEYPRLRTKLIAAGWISVLYCGIKTLQFDMGWMHLTTLFLVSIALFLKSFVERDFAGGAGFWGAILIVFHPILSLPIFGNDFAGILLVKYQPLAAAADQSGTYRFLTGGAGGPVSSFVFQVFLMLDIVRGIFRLKKMPLKTPTQ